MPEVEMGTHGSPAPDSVRFAPMGGEVMKSRGAGTWIMLACTAAVLPGCGHQASAPFYRSEADMAAQTAAGPAMMAGGGGPANSAPAASAPEAKSPGATIAAIADSQ